MLVKEVFEILKSINNNFTKIEKNIRKTQAYTRKSIVVNQLESIDKDLNNINGELSELANIADDKFLNKYEVGSYRKQGPLVQPELALANISNYLHSLDVNFEDFLNTVQSYLDINEQDFSLIKTVFKEINMLVVAFNATEVGYLNSQETKSIGYSNIQKKIISESMNIIGKELDSQLSKHNNDVEKMFLKFAAKMNKVDIAADQNFNELNTKVNTIKDLYEDTLEDLEDKKEQMDEVLGQTANRVMAQDYDLSAVAEKKAANWLRGGSITCMAIIVSIVCYSFYDSTHSGFDWESSIFRTVLVFILSIPAAYLSRESTKHREQQYNYHHTALDLKAITPYIASLPEADQNRIKISIAERIFASRQTNVAQQESFPLNTQDLLMELVKKMSFSEKANSSATEEPKKSGDSTN